MPIDDTATRTFSDFVEASSVELSRIAEILSIGLALEINPVIRQDLRRASGCAPDRPLVLKMPHVPAVMEVDPTGALRLMRQHEAPIDRELHALLVGSPELDARMRLIRTKTREIANELLRPLVLPGTLPSRSEFQSVYKWAPLIEMFAYGFSVRSLSILEELRAGARAEALSERSANGALVGYYAVAHTMANFVLMGSQAQAASWLSEMAGSFVWTRWTPTFPLTRERTVWLAAAAAKSAVAFGPAMVDPYLRILTNASHIFNIFDALFGLAAIALAHKGAHGEILKAIVFHANADAGRSVLGGEYSAAAFRSAIDVLSKRPSEHVDLIAMDRLGWRVSGAGDGLASRRAFRLDPTEIDVQGRMFGFRVLPFIVNAPADHHYPRSKARVPRLRLGASEMSEMMRRAWDRTHRPSPRRSIRHGMRRVMARNLQFQ